MLFAIDLQNDYLDPEGKFYFPAVEDVLGDIKERLEEAIRTGELMACTKNIYPEDEYKDRSAETIAWAQEIHPLFRDLLREAELFEKEHYGISPEGALAFREKFKDRKNDFEFIEFLGVETNVCVLANLNIIQNVFPSSGLTVSARRTVASNPELHRSALEIMKGLKVKVLDDEYIQP